HLAKSVLFLASYPPSIFACSHPGSGCQLLEDVVEKTITAELSPAEYVEAIQEFIPDEATEKAAIQLKQCYLKQSNETLNDFRKMMVISVFLIAYCAPF
uniref:Secretoglobin family 2A member 2 n=1 Tax=Equus asinus asinus TaxID=83772 RepID=A0A8C4L4U9_EQUAS